MTFSYPLAHEDDAQRAVRAGLGMIEAVGQLTTRLERERGVRLMVRLGMHTGLVVVGDVGGHSPGRFPPRCTTRGWHGSTASRP